MFKIFLKKNMTRGIYVTEKKILIYGQTKKLKRKMTKNTQIKKNHIKEG